LACRTYLDGFSGAWMPVMVTGVGSGRSQRMITMASDEQAAGELAAGS
jgi:hypothetical protein